MNLRKIKAFTLIELLVVIAIIGILAALIIVSLSGARNKATDTQRKNNARNLDTALAQYYLDNNTAYPAHATAGGTAIAATSVPTGLTTYLTGTQAYESPGNLTHKYISGTCTGPVGSCYAQAWLLGNKSEATTSTGNGVYAVTGATDAASTVTIGSLDPDLALVGGYLESTQKAFVTYGPQ